MRKTIKGMNLGARTRGGIGKRPLSGNDYEIRVRTRAKQTSARQRIS